MTLAIVRFIGMLASALLAMLYARDSNWFVAGTWMVVAICDAFLLGAKAQEEWGD